MDTAPETTQFYRSGRHRTVALMALLLASFLGTVDVFVVIAIVPAVKNTFDSTLGTTQFVATAYTLAYACTLVTGGRLGDIFGRKRVFVTGTIGFALAALGCATSWSLWILVVFRIVQGSAAGLMLPQVLSVIRGTFPAEAQPRALSLYGATLGMATVCGQAIAGLLLAVDPLRIGWRTVFLVDLVPAIAIVVITSLVVPATGGSSTVRLPRLGPILLVAGLAMILIPLSTGATHGWSSVDWICAGLGVAVSVVFVTRELRLADRGEPTLLPSAALRSPGFRLGVLTVFTYYSGTAALNMLLSYFLQSDLGRDALTAGLQFAPLGIGFMIGSLIAGRVESVVRLSLPVAGCLLMALTRLLMLYALTGGGLTKLVLFELMLLVTGVAQGFVVAPLIALILSRAPVADAGAAAGTVMMSSNTAVAFGVAGIGAVFSVATSRWDSSTGFSLALVVMTILALVSMALSFILTRANDATAQ